MRLLNRLHQYQRLWEPSSGEPQQVTVGELAGRCFCSETPYPYPAAPGARIRLAKLAGQLRSWKARIASVL